MTPDAGISNSPDGLPSPAIPGHELRGRIARGAYGEVWLARNDFGEHRAVKIVRRDSFDNPRPYDRELAGLRRYEPVSREHEGLVDVLQVGCDDAAGFFYYVMELADDVNAEFVTRNAESNNPATPHFALRTPHSYTPQTLAHEIRRRGRLPVNEVVEIGIALCRALEFLHARRLIHRDIKPANIIFVGGQPKLADVGLIAHLDTTFTRGDMGTTGYIAPEGANTEQADLYSLGKVLYEAATGKAHYEFPDLPTLLGDGAEDAALIELNEVLLKACETNPRSRYRTASAMAADLERLKTGQSLRKRRIQIHRVRTFALLFGVLAIVITAMVALYFSSRPLFSDDFDAVNLDTNSWTQGYVYVGEPTGGLRTFDLGLSGGEVKLASLALHESGNTRVASGWIDLKRELRQLAPCRLEVELSGHACRGRLFTAITDGNVPEIDAKGVGAILAELNSDDINFTNKFPASRLRVDILPKSEVAVVWRDASRLDQMEIVELADLKLWRLRFYCWSASSGSFGQGVAEFSIAKVSIISIREDKLILGRVLESVSEMPLANAEIKDESGRILTKSQTNGTFALLRPKRTERLTVSKPGYGSLGDQPFVPEEIRAFATVHLQKLRPEVGDQIEAISYGRLVVTGIGFLEDTLSVLVHDTDTQFRILPVDLDKRQIDVLSPRVLKFDSPSLVSDFARCGELFVGMKHWPGEVFDLDDQPPRLLAALRNQQDDDIGLRVPAGCAFDGKLLWFTEHDQPTNRFGLHAFDLQAKKIVSSKYSSQFKTIGLAWDEERFWVSTDQGEVLAITREDLIGDESLDEALKMKFRGDYQRLAFGRGFLWGLDQDRRRICKIKISD